MPSDLVISDHLKLISPFTKQSVGPSGVRALPLAAGRNVGGHYKWHFFSLSSSDSSGSLLILTVGIVVWF